MNRYEKYTEDGGEKIENRVGGKEAEKGGDRCRGCLNAFMHQRFIKWSCSNS